MDGVSAIGFAASIVQLVQVGGQVVNRLIDYIAHAESVPKAFRKIHSQLPVLLDNLSKTQQFIDAHELDKTAHDAIGNIISDSLSDIKAIQKILDDVLPAAGDSKVNRGWKSLLSLQQEKKVNDIATGLESNAVRLSEYILVNFALGFNQLRLGNAVPESLVPFAPDPHFVGREKLLDAIHDGFRCYDRLAIVGIGGAGKSQLAIQYAAQLFNQQPKWIFWLRASSRDRFIQSCTNTARRLRIPGFDDPSLDVNQLFMDWLHDKRNGSWLLILDNCDDAEVFSHTTQPNLSINLPQAPHGKVLLTSRNQAAALSVTVGVACIIDVGAMHVDEALEMFRRKLPNDGSPETDCISLATELGCLPLALGQATAYMSNNRMSISKYLAYFKKNENHQKRLLLSGLNDRNREPDLKNSIILTWQLSFDQIQAQHPGAAELLSLMSLFDRQSIPRKLLIEKEEDELDFEEALATLANFSLVSTEIGQETLVSMHRLVQLTVHLWLQQNEKFTTFKAMAITRLYKALPESYIWEVDAEYSLLYPHALAVFRYDVHDLSSFSQLQYSDILYNVGIYDGKMSRYDVACERLESALFFRKLHSGPEDPLTLLATGKLALALKEQGKPFEAENMCLGVLETNERLYGAHDLIIADSCDNIGEILASRKLFSRAEKYYRRALFIREKQLNGDDHAVLSSANNLANILAVENQIKEAAKLHHQALDGFTKLFGPTHPDSLSAMNNYAGDLAYLGEFEKAEVMQRQVLEAETWIFGQDSPAVLCSMGNLAEYLDNLGRDDEAKKLLCQRIELSQQRFGSTHIETLGALFNAASAYALRGAFEEAEEMYRRCYRGWVINNGWQHTETIRAALGIALMLHDQHKPESEDWMLAIIQEVKAHLDGGDEIEIAYRDAIALRDRSMKEESLTRIRNGLNGQYWVHPSQSAEAADQDVLYNLFRFLKERGHDTHANSFQDSFGEFHRIPYISKEDE